MKVPFNGHTFLTDVYGNTNILAFTRCTSEYNQANTPHYSPGYYFFVYKNVAEHVHVESDQKKVDSEKNSLLTASIQVGLLVYNHESIQIDTSASVFKF